MEICYWGAFSNDNKKVCLYGYGWCRVVDRETVLQDLDYQYEGTDHVVGYDIYSNDDGDYFAVKEGDN